tara:strand:- start:13 stop:294 length:282 start_codon:yes stop_codon:yes gene_type:complete
MANSRKYKSITIHGKKYPEVDLYWEDILGDSTIAVSNDFDKMKTAQLINRCYIYKRTKNYIWTFASYQTDDESFGDRNIFPVGVVKKIVRIPL